MEVVKEGGDEEQQQQTETVDSKLLKQNDPIQCQCGYLYPANLPNDYCDICYYEPEDTKNHVCDCHCDACPRFLTQDFVYQALAAIALRKLSLPSPKSVASSMTMARSTC